MRPSEPVKQRSSSGIASPELTRLLAHFSVIRQRDDATMRAAKAFAASATTGALVANFNYRELQELLYGTQFVGSGTDTLAVLRLPGTDAVLRICELGASLDDRRPIVRELLLGAELRRLQAGDPRSAAHFLIGVDSFALFVPQDASRQVGEVTSVVRAHTNHGPRIEITDAMPPEVRQRVHEAAMRIAGLGPVNPTQLCSAYARNVAWRYQRRDAAFSYYMLQTQRYAQGPTLEAVLTDPAQRLRAARAVYVVLQQLALLRAKYGFVHMDLQTRNIVLEPRASAAAVRLLHSSDGAALGAAYADGVPVLIDINRALMLSLAAELRVLNGPSVNGASGAEDVRRLGLYVLHAWYARPIDEQTPLLNRVADAVLFRVAAAMVPLPGRWLDAAEGRAGAGVLMYGEWNPVNKDLAAFVNCYGELHDCLVESAGPLGTLDNNKARANSERALRCIGALIHDLNYYMRAVVRGADSVKAADARCTPEAVLPAVEALLAALDAYAKVSDQ